MQDESQALSSRVNPDGMLGALDIVQFAPDLSSIDNRKHIEILVLAAAGISPTTIARECGVSRNTVYVVVEKYNLKDAIRDGIALQKVILGTAIGATMVDAISALRSKVGDFSEMKPREIVGLIQMCADVMNRIGKIEQPRKDVKRASIVDRLKNGEENKRGRPEDA